MDLLKAGDIGYLSCLPLAPGNLWKVIEVMDDGLLVHRYVDGKFQEDMGVESVIKFTLDIKRVTPEQLKDLGVTPS